MYGSGSDLTPSALMLGDGDMIEPYERPSGCSVEEAKTNGVYHPFQVNIICNNPTGVLDETKE